MDELYYLEGYADALKDSGESNGHALKACVRGLGYAIEVHSIDTKTEWQKLLVWSMAAGNSKINDAVMDLGKKLRIAE